jgi:hypothetical protein
VPIFVVPLFFVVCFFGAHDKDFFAVRGLMAKISCTAAPVFPIVIALRKEEMWRKYPNALLFIRKYVDFTGRA